MSDIGLIIRLTRPVNLLIIAATMYALRFFVLWPLLKAQSIGLELSMSETAFFFSVLVMVLLAAAGNVINDYFDQKVDRINKPDRVIVGKRVKRRVAMILHQGMNILAVLITALLCLSTGRWSALLFPILIATLLWFYSPVFKKKAFIGNLVVAICVAAVPIWTGWFEIYINEQAYSDMLLDGTAVYKTAWGWLLAYAGFSFLLTLAREAAKDLEDLAGDQDGGYTTLPISMGEAWTRNYTAILLGISLMSVIALVVFQLDAFKRPMALVHGSWALFIPLGVAILAISRARTKAHYTRASRWIKVCMAGGILFTWYASQVIAEL